MVKRINSITAWVLIQAFFLSQVLPGLALADTLRAQSAEGTAKSGLEEELVSRPARGFGTRVARVMEPEPGVQIEVARRDVGSLVGTSSWDVAAGTLSAAVAAAETEAAPSSISPDQVLDWARQGLAWLSARTSLPVVQKVWGPISGKTLSVELRANHALTLDLSDDDTTIRMDVSIAPEMADARYEKGRSLLYAFGLFHEAAQVSGFSTRASIHLLMALYDQLSKEEREPFHAILQSPYVDHGGIWDFFFRQVVDDRQFQAGATRAQKALPKIHLMDEGIRGVDTLTLVDRRDADGVSVAEQNRLDWVTDYRDTWASWLIGMLQFDIPFDYKRFMAIYRDPSIDLDTKRQLLYQIVRSYSVEAERQNAARISRDAAERGQKVIAGRFSTAFLDEGNEVASAQFVRVTDDLRQAVVRLHEAATALQETSRGDREAENAAEILVRSTEGLLTVILQSAGVTRGEIMKFLDMEDHVGEVYGAIEKHQLLRLRAVDRAQAAAEKRREAGALGRKREFDTQPFDQQRQAVQEEGSRIRQLADAARTAFRQAPKETYARMVALQRASETGAINYAYGIGFAPRPGQAPNLRERIRTGGQNTWMSPDLAWVEWANYLVEFIPLFIGERVLRVELPDGRQVDRREVEVNQQQLEVAIRAMADAFAVNIERTAISEYIALARECLCGARLGSQALETLAAERGITREEAARVVVREMEPEQREQWVREIAQAAAGLARRADREEERIQQAMVDSWTEGAEVSRFEMLRSLFLVQADGTPRYAEVVAQAQKEMDPKRDAELLKAYDEAALEKRRPLPMWIMGTTEAPGLTEAFVLSWLEEEMALRNVIRAANHEQDVRELLKRYRQQLVEMGRVVLREFGYERQIDARAAEQELSPEEAVLDLIGENEILQAEVAKLAVLRGWAEQTETGYRFNGSSPDPRVVIRKLDEADPATQDRIDREARRIVWEQNRADLQKEVDQAIRIQGLDFDAALTQVIESKQVLGQRPYLAHWESARRWVARELVIQELGLEPNVRRWYREHTHLARTIARQTVVDRYQLRGLMVDPRHNYQSDGTYLQDSDTWAPNAWKMRYLIAAGPSQVDLGGEDTTSKQLKSISIWPKWGGVVSRAGEEALRGFYGPYHYRLEILRLDQAEDMKVLKNSRTAMGRAVMNLIGRVTVNDAQVVALQTRTHGDPLADMFAYQEPDKPGATAGYCIPKDILFKVFVSQLQDAQALHYVGVPDAQIPDALALVRRLWGARRDYDSEIQWERWATGELIAFSESLKQYVDLDQRGVLIFNVTRIAKMLDKLGVPSAYPGFTQNIYRGLAAWVAAERISDLEAVNRAEALGMSTDILSAIAYSHQINAGAVLTPPERVSMQLPAPYKGTGKGSSLLPDVRYSRTLGIAQVMTALPGVPPQEAGLEEAPRSDVEAAGFRLLEPLTASLRPQDEALFFLGLRGFRPTSADPVDRQVTRFVAERLGINRRSVETLPGFVEARKALPTDAPDYLDRLEALVTEWIARTVTEDQSYAQQVARLHKESKPRVAPDQVTITGSPQTSVGDVLGYITEKGLWEKSADEALAILQAHGLTLAEIRARAKSGDPFSAWIAHLPEAEQTQIRAAVGGRHIPLALREGGLGTNFWQDIQGKDVVVLGVPHDAVLKANPAHLIQSMRRGNPGFLGVIADHSIQGRPRVWHGHRQWAPDVMLAFAAGLGFDKEGNPITDWERRAQEGRKVVYVANSLPAGSQIVETWRRKELEMENRARRVVQSLRAVAAAQSGDRRKAVDQALEIFRREVTLSAVTSEFHQVRAYEAEVGPDGLNLFKDRDRAMTGSLGTLVRGMNEAQSQRGDPALWLGRATRAEIAAAGLMFLLNGETPERIEETLGVVDQALGILREEIESRGLGVDISFQKPVDSSQAAAWTKLLIEPRLQIEISDKKRKQVEVSSVKAPETVNKALAQRAALVLQAEREIHLSRRGAGYREAMKSLESIPDPEGRWAAATGAVQQDLDGVLAALGSADASNMHLHTGRVFAWTQTAAHAAVDRWVPDAQERLNWHAQIDTLTRGRELNENAWKMFVRLHGLLPRLFELTVDDPQRRESVAQLMTMAHSALALEKMAPYLTADRAYVNEPAFWLDLLDFFGQIINDHFDERLPWAFSLARGNGFQESFDSQERLLPEKRGELDLYRFAWRHHQWLYQFLRQLMIDKTQLADWPEERRDPLLGQVLPGRPTLPPIGGGAPAGDEAMQRWRGYLQLREVANWGQTSVAMLQDTFRPLAEQVGPVTQAMMPYVFTQPVDPVLIGADRGAGLGFFSGIGRPHYQQMIREAADPDMGDNVFITEHGRFLTPEGQEPRNPEEFDRASLWIDDAHFWVSLETFRQMLVETEGLNAEQADARIRDLQARKQIHPKGVRVAARFSRPVAVGAAVTLHHHYLEPQLSRAGYPTGEKSEVLFAVTYGKIYGPSIVQGRDLQYPRQANVYQDQTLAQPAADVRRSIGEQVSTFANQLGFPAFFAKGSRESGSRNLKDFDASTPAGETDSAVLADAAEFTYQVSSGQDVVLSQDVSLTNSNQTFLTPAIVQHMRDRAVREFGVDVNLDQPGKADVTTVRVTATSPRPDVPYSPAHVLLITSYTGKATNIARQNVAEPLRPEFLRPEIRDNFLNGLMASAPEAMRAMADFTRRFWHEGVTLPDGRVIPAYKEVYRQQNGAYPREFDARGVPYWYPTWLMLDYVPSATFQSARDGQPLKDVRILDIDPGDPRKGTLPVFTLQDRHGNRIQGKVTGHVPWLLEWNVGIGQVPEYNRREQYWEYDRAKKEAARSGVPDQWFERVQWDHVGVADRQALKSWLVTARETRSAKGFPAAWPESPAPPVFRPGLPAVSEKPTAPVRVDPLAASLRGVQARLGAVPLTENTVSLWLSAYAFRQLGSSLRVRDLRSGETEYESSATAFTGDVLTLLQDPTLAEGMSQLIAETKLSISTDHLRNLLQGTDSDARVYRERIAFQVLGDVLADPQTVMPVAILPTPLSPAVVAERLNQPNRFVVVVGKELRMDHAVEPFALSAAGQPINVLGVHTDWLTPGGELKRVQIYDLASRICWECALTAPLRLSRSDHATAVPRAYIVDLPREEELQQHARVTEQLRAGGIEPVNPTGEAQRRADDKAYLLARRDPDRTHWTLVAQPTGSAQTGNRVEEFARAHAGESFVVQPRAGTSEAEGVRVIPPGDQQVKETAEAVALLQRQGKDVILQRFWGNVTMGGREFVLRSNVAGDGIQSEYVLVAPFGERVVSVKRGAAAHAREDVLEHLIGPEGTIAVSPERLAELDRQAVEVARQINQGVPVSEQIGFIAIDRRFWLDETGQLQQVILEANARGGGLIAAEPQAVNENFWRTSGLRESPSAIQWRSYLQDPAQAQILLSPQYQADMLPEKQAQLLGWLERLKDLRTPQGTPAFPEKAGVLMDRTPGRAVLMGRGLDYLDNNGGSVGFPTRQEVVGFVEVVDGLNGQVEMYVVDPAPELIPDYPDEAKGPRSFNLGHPWVNPDRSVRTLNEWDDWAGPVEQARRLARSPADPNHAKMNYADDMAAAAVAFLRTEFGDPSGKAREFFDRLQREGKGLRIAVAGDLPVGGGLSSSSAVLESVLQAVDQMADLKLGPEGLVNAGFAERVYTGVRAGTKDHGHMMTDAAFRGVVPTRMIEPLILPPGLSLLLIDSKVSRDNAPQFSTKMREPGNDERNIKWRTGIGYALGVLWIRQHHPELESRLLPGVFPASPHGLLRELQPGSENGLTLKQLYEILREIPAEGLTRDQLRQDLPNFQAELESMFGQTDPPPQPYPVREMVLFGLAEEARNWEMVRLGHQGEQGVSVSEIQPQMLGVVARAQDGDRVVKYQVTGSLGDEHLELKEEPWNWRMTNERLDWLIEHPGDPDAVLWKQSGWRERSIEPLDRLVDLVRFFSDQHGGGVAEAMVGGAGLGGTVVTLMVRPDLIQPLLDFLLKHYYRDFLKLDLQEVPFRLAKPGRAAGVLTVPQVSFIQQAGLEETPPSPIISHQLEETGIEGYLRLVYTLADGSTWTGGVVRTDVPSGAIAPTAYVAPYSYVEGKATLLRDNARLLNGSAVIDSAVSENAQLAGSVAERGLVHSLAVVSDSVLQPAFGRDDWSYSPATENDPALSVRNHSVTTLEGGTYQVELGEGASAQGSVLQDSYVGPGSSVRGSAVYISHLGPKSQLDGGVKLWLAVAQEGSVQIAGVQHRPDGTEVEAALEWAEGAIVGLPQEQYPGEQFRERRVGYTEVVVSNRVPLVHYDEGQLMVEQYPVPPITLAEADYGIFSIFAGSPNPGSIKTDGRSTPGVVTRLTGGPGEQTSQHGRIVADPLSIVSSFSNVIGRLLGFPAWGDSEALMNEPEITHLGPLSAVGVDAQLGLNGLEAWGPVAPGEARGQLGRASGIAPWVFLYSPEVLFTLMGRLAEGLPASDRSRYDDLPQKILESGLAFSRWMLDQEQAKDAQANAAVIKRLNRYIAGYTALIDSGAWTGEWVQEGMFRHPAGWSRTAAGDWETGRLSLEEAHQTIHPLADSVPYSQVSLQQLLVLPPGVERPDWSEWTPYYLKPQDLQVDPPTPPDQLQPVSDADDFEPRKWRIIGQDEKFYYTVEGGRIGKEVNLDNIHPSALIGPGTVLNGESTSIGEGSRLLRVVANDTTIGKEVRLTAVRSDFASIGNNVNLTWAKLTESSIGSGTTGAYVTVADHSTIGSNTTFEPFALVINSTTAPGNVIGVSLVNSKVLPGFMGRHLSTAVHGLQQQPVRFEINGKTYDLGAASLNVAGGLFIQGREDAPIRLSAAYPLSLTTITPGTGFQEIGPFSVLKNQVVLDGQILPLTFHAFNNLPSSDPRFATAGRHNDAIGGALDFPGIFLRNFIYRTKKGIWDDLTAQGLTPEEIAVHPRLLQADYMVEATIVDALENVLAQLKEIDPAAYNRLSGEDRQSLELKQLIQYLKQDLSQIEQPDQTVLGVRPQEIRGGVRGMIQEVDRVLQNLPGERPSEVSSSGHSSAQLLDGIGRLARNLNGRWRMRDHTFTEVEWRYVAREGERALDTWKPVFKEEITLHPKAARNVVVLTPETAPRGIELLGGLRVQGGEKLQLSIIVADAEQQRQVEAMIPGDHPTLKLRNLVSLEGDLSQLNGEIDKLLAVLQAEARTENIHFQVFRTLRELANIGLYLEIPPASAQLWKTLLEQLQLSPDA